MNAVRRIISRILGTIPARGTIRTPSGNETYPVALSNEIMGGPFIVDSLEELKEIPRERLLPGCKCTVNEHEVEGRIRPTTTYILRKLPSVTLSLMITPNISEFWVLDTPEHDEESQVEYQYAPDYRGTKPLFLRYDITKENYNDGYGSNEDSGTPSKIIWKDEYDYTEHNWFRQRSSIKADWSNPMKINEGYEEGTYNDIRFQWLLKADGEPARPEMSVDGLINNEPFGWEDTPIVPDGETYSEYRTRFNLWRISAIKDVYQDLVSPWTKPILVSTDPNIVRYGNIATNKEFTNTAYWRGEYTIGDKYKATFDTDKNKWLVEKISGESGEYTDYVFKEFPDSDEPTIDDAPKTVLGYGNDDWFDGVFTVREGYTMYVSTARKYSNGDLITNWSIPMRFDGKNSIRATVVPQGSSGQVFKYKHDAGQQTVVPTSIVLEAKLFDGSKEVDAVKFTRPTQWYLGDENGTLISPGTPGMPSISGTNNSVLTVSPDHVLSTQTITAKVWLEGEDYFDDITLNDVTDGVGYVVYIEGEDGFTFKNGEGEKEYKGHLYQDGNDISSVSGVTYKWFLNKNELGTTDREITIHADDVMGIAPLKLEVTFEGNTYSAIEDLTDIVDGKSVERKFSSIETLQPGSTPSSRPTDWGNMTPTTIWAIERVTGEAWGIPYRIKGEKGEPSGAFQKTVYRLFDPANPTWSSDLTKSPTARSGDNDILVPEYWSENPPSTAPANSTVYGSKATFMKTVDTTDTAELVKNWKISKSEGSNSGWSKPFKVSHFHQSGAGPAGENGNNGWSPVMGLQSINNGAQIVPAVVDWVGGTGSKPYSSTVFPSSDGLKPYPSDINNIKGPKGNNGADGIFRASDYWDGPIYRIYGSNGSPHYESWDFRFRKAKTGIVYVIGRSYRNGGGARWVDFSLDSLWQSKMKPVTDLKAGVSFPTNVIIAGGHVRDGVNPSVGNEDRASNALIIGNKFRVMFSDDYVVQFSGSYPTADAFGL